MKRLILIGFGIMMLSKAYSQPHTICCDQTIYYGEDAQSLSSDYAPSIVWYCRTMTGDWISLGDQGPYYDYGVINSMTETLEFYAVQTDGPNTYETNIITVTVIPAFSPGTITESRGVCSNETVGTIGFTTVPTGGDQSYTYRWQENGVDMKETGTTISIGTLSSTTTYTCYVDGGAGERQTNTCVISVSSGFNQGNIGYNQDVCFNTPANELISITSPINGKLPIEYQWYYSSDSLNWVSLPSDTNMSYSPGIIKNVSYYQRLASDACGSDDVSNVVKLTVREKLSDPVTDLKNIYCRNDSVKINITNPLKNNCWYDAGKVFILNSTRFDFGTLIEDSVLYLNSVDEKGCSTDTIEVKALVDPVEAEFRVANATIHPNDAVQFENNCINAKNYKWNFYGQAEPATEMEPIKYYYTVGLFDVSLWVSSENNCSDSVTKKDAVKVLPESSVGEAENETFHIYPLPVKDNLFIECSGESGAIIHLYDISGQLLLEKKIEKEKNNIDMSSFDEGSYLLKVYSEDGEEFSKTIVKW